MNNTMKTLVYLLIISVSVFFVSKSRSKDAEYVKISGLTQGTTYNITYEDIPGRNLVGEVDSLLALFDKSLSAYDTNSLISRINATGSVLKVDKLFRDVYKRSYDIYLASDGAFDITVGQVVNAWGFGPEPSLKTDSAAIDSLLQFTGMGKTHLKGWELYKDDYRVKLDVNAIAQGYSVDIVADYLEKLKIKNYLVEIGGEIKAKGRNAKDIYWRIGLDKPVEGNTPQSRELQAVIQLKNMSLATSGNYRRFYEKNGVKYAHSINPKTGYPVVRNLLSATIVADDCMTADAYATACMVAGLEKAIEMVEAHKGLEAYLIYADTKGEFQVYKTKGIEGFILDE